MKPSNHLAVKATPFLLLYFSTFLLLSASPTDAQVPLENAFLLKSGTTVAKQFPDLHTLVSTFLPNALILSGLILLFIIFGAGFTLIKSGNNPEAKEKGKAGLKGAIIGFGIVFASYWIIQIIEILTGVKILNPNSLS